jgi:tetratricopeptide (TPR) repeat protein
MPKKDELRKALETADKRDEIGYARYLCELYLKQDPEDVATLLRYANNSISLGQYSAAKEAIDRAETIVSEKWRDLVLLKRGCLLKAQGDFSGAEEMFLRAHELDPDDATYLIYAGTAAFARGDVDRALRLAQQATKCTEGCTDEAYFNLGGYFLSKRRYREAAECYRKALKIDPKYKIAKKRLKDVERILAHRS